MLGQVFERFVAKSPISVMVRAALERVLGAPTGSLYLVDDETLKEWFVSLGET